MVAIESAVRMRFRRGIVPSASTRPAFLLTATRVPTLSNRSTNRKTKMISKTPNPALPIFKAPLMSRAPAVAVSSVSE